MAPVTSPSRPQPIFEIVAAAIQEAEKMLRETRNVYDFNAQFKRSRGLPSLLQKSNGPDPDQCFSLEEEHYSQAKLAIEPGGDGLGRRFLQRFLPPHSVASNSTLQAAITAYYQERWREEGDRLMEQSRLARTSNAPRSSAARQTRQAKPSASQKQAIHGRITRRKLGIAQP